MSVSRKFGRSVVFCLCLLSVSWLLAGTIKRARPPKWPVTDKGTFFADAREQLSGTRPAGGVAIKVGGPATAAPAAEGNAPAAAAGGGFAWSKLIDAETIEAETKTNQSAISTSISTPDKFKGGGYKDGRLLFSVQAVLFGVIAEYDGDVRWKKQAAGMRDLLARAGHNCKAGNNIAVYNEAKLRKDDLENLVRGNPPQIPNGETSAPWPKTSDRPPLMTRIEKAQQEVLTPSLANAADFKKNADKITHEAQLLAIMGEVITREGFEFADDETYLGYARALRDGALEIVDAVKQKNYEAARKASGAIDKACSNCHEGYRS